jgi:hypothetical protein
LRALPIADVDVYTYAHVVCLAERAGSRMIKAFFEVVDDLLASGGVTGPSAGGDR